MSLLIFSGISIGVFLLALMVSKRNKLQADRYLILYLVFFVTSQIFFLAESYGFFTTGPWMLLGRVSYLLGAPLFFYYLYTLTKGSRPSTLLVILTLLPAAGYVLMFTYYYVLGFDNSMVIKDGLLYIDNKLSFFWTLFVILFVLSDPFYITWFYFLFRDYKKRMHRSLSSTDHVNLNWLTILFYCWAISALILFPISAFSIGHSWISLNALQGLLQLFNVAFIFVAGYYGFRQASVFTDNEVPKAQRETKAAVYERSGLTKKQASAYHSHLLLLMKKEKPYLEGELTARILAEKAGISTNHLSQVLTQEQRQNFFDFVNGYRVQEVKEKMADPNFSHYTLLAIALESGFNSKTSFNTVFKSVTQKTPSQYYSALKKGEKS